MSEPSRQTTARPRARLSTIDIVAAMAVCLGLVLLTYLYVEDRKSDIEANLSADARSELRYVTAKLETHVNSRIDVARRIRSAWLMGYINETEGLRSFAEAEMSLFDDVQAINWVDPDGVIRWVNPLAGNAAAVGLDVTRIPAANAAFETTLETGRVALSQPLQLAQGGLGVVLYLQISPGGRHLGFVNIAFRFPALISGALNALDTPAGVRIVVIDQDRDVFESRSASEEASIVATDTIAIANRQWQVRLYLDEPPLYRDALSANNLFLMIGAVASIIVGALLAAVLYSIRSLRMSENRLTDFAEASSDWFWEADQELRFTFFSNRFYEQTGLTADQVIGKTAAQIESLSTPGSKVTSVIHRMARAATFRDLPFQRIKPNGETVRFSLSGVPAYDDGNRFIGYRGAGSDVTDRWRFEQQLATALRDAEEANHAKTRFLATLSHELRTPMNAILGFSEFLRNQLFGPLDDRYRGYAEDIHSSGNHLLSLIDDLLSYSTLEAGERRLLPEKIDVKRDISEIVKSVEGMAQQKTIALDVEVPNTPLFIEADSRSFKQVLTNLLTNAIKFTDPRGRVTVTARAVGRGVEIVTTDTGIGIAENQIEKVLEPFAQAATHPDLAQEGTGLGLAIVKGLLDAHGGMLRIESTVGVGTSVTIWFPFAFRGRPEDSAAE